MHFRFAVHREQPPPLNAKHSSINGLWQLADVVTGAPTSASLPVHTLLLPSSPPLPFVGADATHLACQ
jgi:hypothetical protein